MQKPGEGERQQALPWDSPAVDFPRSHDSVMVAGL